MGSIIDEVTSKRLKPSETLLWSHGVDPEFTTPIRPSLLQKRGLKTIGFLLYAFNAYLFSRPELLMILMPNM